MIIYIWKVLEGIVPNINNKIKSYQSVRHGRECIIPQNKNLTGRLKTIRESMAPIHGSNLFNALPSAVRNLSAISLVFFKRTLDKCLQNVPDEPQIPGYTTCRRANTNSIINMFLVSNSIQVFSFGRMQHHHRSIHPDDYHRKPRQVRQVR